MGLHMTSKWIWYLLKLTRRLWVRAVLFAVISIAAALVGPLVAPYLSSDLGTKIGADAVDSILSILASSMLAVTTFSLSVMVQAFGTASSNVTPRATHVLLEDSTTHIALATFLGAFIFALVGIIALRAGIYDMRGRVVLFGVTIFVVIVIVVTMMRWIEHLTRFGRVTDTTYRVELMATQAICNRRSIPCLGAHALIDPDRIPSGAYAVLAQEVGYIQHIDIPAISACAEEMQAQVYIACLPGVFVHRGTPLLYVAEAADPAVNEDRLRCSFTIADRRSFDSDPRFGLCVLSEIASRALSPGINDPGTAIDVISRLVRVLAHWSDDTDPEKVRFPRLWVPPLKVADFLDDAIAPIARDGAGLFEVQIRIQKALLSFAEMDATQFGGPAKIQSQRALALAGIAGLPDHDRQRLAHIADQIQTAP